MKTLRVTDSVWNQSAATVLTDSEHRKWVRFELESEAGDLYGCYCRLTQSTQYPGKHIVGFGHKDDRDWNIPIGEVHLDNPNETEVRACRCYIELHSVGAVSKRTARGL